MEIYSKNKIKIEKIDDYFLIEDLNTNAEHFWNSFQILNHKIEKNLVELSNVKIYGSSFITLKDYLIQYENLLPYDIGVKLLVSLFNQCINMYKNGVIIPFFDLESIVMIDDDFYYINSFKVIYEKNGKFLYTRPFKKNIFISPEIETGQLPLVLDFSSTLYSLGSLIGFCLTNTEITYENKNKKLDFINYSKLFFCLKRLLVESKQSRVFLFV